MVLFDSISDREKYKFLELRGKHTVRVTNVGNFQIPEDADTVTASYPDAVTEIYEYRQGGVGGVILATVTIIFVDATHSQILSVVST